MKRKLLLTIGVLLVAVATWAFVFRKGEESSGEVEFRYSTVAKGELVQSISATGSLVALTTVDVKSKAGGKVVQLAVDEGSVVKKGDLIAIIDPSDTQATYEQAQADLTSAEARATQASANYELQVAQSKTAVEDARASLDTARIRLERARIEAKRQPALSTASVQTAQASYDEALAERNRLDQVTIPQLRRDVQGTYDRTKSELDVAEADLRRQKDLFQKGYVAQAAVEQAQSRFDGARSAFNLADQNLKTVDRQIAAQRAAVEAAASRALASLNQAKANRSETDISQKGVQEAEKAVRAAEINLQKAINDQTTNRVRAEEVRAARAATVRNKVSVNNAKVQLDSTTVLAPRDGVVTQKYLEEGTIIPPGTSTFAQGTSLVELSDVTQLFVECAVDEADIANVKVGQRVRITTEAFPGMPLEGKVTRVNPAAKTEQNVTAVKVRVQVLPSKVKVMPGMSATCEFITMFKPGVLMLPRQALEQQDGKTTVLVKSKDPLKPETREVKVGDSGNDGVEIVSGLKEGEEVVIAKLDLKAMRETQQKMLDAQQGGGLAGGGMRGMRTLGGTSGARGGGSAGGGARPGGGAAGGAPRAAAGGGAGGARGGGGR